MIEVYYAEDDESIVQSVKEYLERNDAKIVVFKTISEIKSALMNHLPDVVLLDWNMPDGQGSGEWNTDEKSFFKKSSVYRGIEESHIASLTPYGCKTIIAYCWSYKFCL